MSNEELIAAIKDEFPQLDPKQVHADSVLLDLLGWSSLNLAIVRAKIIDEFGVELTDDEIKGASDIKTLASLISDKQ